MSLKYKSLYVREARKRAPKGVCKRVPQEPLQEAARQSTVRGRPPEEPTKIHPKVSPERSFENLLAGALAGGLLQCSGGRPLTVLWRAASYSALAGGLAEPLAGGLLECSGGRPLIKASANTNFYTSMTSLAIFFS